MYSQRIFIIKSKIIIYTVLLNQPKNLKSAACGMARWRRQCSDKVTHNKFINKILNMDPQAIVYVHIECVTMYEFIIGSEKQTKHTAVIHLYCCRRSVSIRVAKSVCLK